MENWIEKVIAKWKLEGVKLNPPATISEFNQVESTLNFKFPKDFKDFYLVADGFKGLGWQEHMFTLWPLKLIVEEFEISDDNNFIGFCDYLIASHFIGFHKTSLEIIKVYNKVENSEVIAQSFEEVIGMINSNSDLVY